MKLSEELRGLQKEWFVALSREEDSGYDHGFHDARVECANEIDAFIAKVEQMERREEGLVKCAIAMCIKRCEEQRQKILGNSADPSWTEHLAEVQITLRDSFTYTSVLAEYEREQAQKGEGKCSE